MQISFDLRNMSFQNNSIDGQTVSTHLTDVVRKLQEEASDSNSKEDSKLMEKIQAKIKSGKKLTKKEESYLKEHNPELYKQYLRIRRMAENLEHQLKNAQSKEEVNDIIFFAYNSISDKDEYKAAIVAALDEVVREFKKTDAYASLPANNDEIEESRKSNRNEAKGLDQETDNASIGEDDFDVMAWSPLQEVIDSMPTLDLQS